MEEEWYAAKKKNHNKKFKQLIGGFDEITLDLFLNVNVWSGIRCVSSVDTKAGDPTGRSDRENITGVASFFLLCNLFFYAINKFGS